MSIVQTLSKSGIFPATVAGIPAGIANFYVGDELIFNQMLPIPTDNASTVYARSNWNPKPNSGFSATDENSLAFSDSLFDLGKLHLGSADAKFKNNIKSESAVSEKDRRDELTGMNLVASKTSGIIPAENLTFDFKNYTIDHQGLTTLNINIDSQLKPGIFQSEYPDLVPIYKSIDNFLIDYPNETDSWEIVNKNLTQKLLDENPALTEVEITIEVLPANRFPDDRASTVFRSRTGKLQENGNFSVKDYGINHQGSNKLNLDVNYQYQPGITPAQYPDYRQIYQSIDKFLTNYPNETDFWEIVNKNLTQSILNENPVLAEINLNLSVLPTPRLPYNRTTKVRRTQASNPEGTFLIGNTRGNNVLRFDGKTGDYLGEFITASTGGLSSPDAIIFGPDGNGDGKSDIYIASGNKPGNSQEAAASGVLRYDGITGEFIDKFVADNPNTAIDETGGLLRPYGLAFDREGNLYVSSFLTDKILRYNGKTGQFIDVFAAGNQQSGGLNGPNNLLFAPDGYLYVTTQGSVARNGEADFSANFPSQVLRYNPQTKQFSIFASPDPSPRSFGFASLLGMAIGPVDGDLYVSDFASDIRRYNLKSGELIEVLPTNYTQTLPSSNFVGSLDFSPIGNLFAVGFDNRANANNIGAVLRYDGNTGDPLPLVANRGTVPTPVFVSPDSKLQRPIAIAFFPSDAKLTEKWNFNIPNYPINHQGLNNLNVDVNYQYQPGIKNYDYPDFVPIYKTIDNLLVNYPNETDFWEIVNKKLTQTVLESNPALASVTVNLDVLPTNRLPYNRSSTVTRTQNGKLGEGWDFKLANYAIDHQGLNNLNIDVKYQYKPGIANDEYPDYVPIYKSIDNFLVNYPNETDFWEILNKNLTQKVLAQNPALDSLQIAIDVLSTNRSPDERASIVAIV